jgi:hypothetical protein
MVSLQLSQALPGFRTALDSLSSDIPEHGDALLACSLLLLQFSWEFTLPTSEESHSENAGWHTMLGLYRGVRNVINEVWGMNSKSSRFAQFWAYNPKKTIELYFENTIVPPNIEACFNHCLTCTKISNNKGDDLNICIDASQRLIGILCALKMGPRELEDTNLLIDVARCLFTWPTALAAKLFELSETSDKRCHVIMLLYFAAIARIRSEQFWWMRDRAIYMFETLFLTLQGECEECTGMIRQLFDEDDDVLWC